MTDLSQQEKPPLHVEYLSPFLQTCPTCIDSASPISQKPARHATHLDKPDHTGHNVRCPSGTSNPNCPHLLHSAPTVAWSCPLARFHTRCCPTQLRFASPRGRCVPETRDPSNSHGRSSHLREAAFSEKPLPRGVRHP